MCRIHRHKVHLWGLWNFHFLRVCTCLGSFLAVETTPSSSPPPRRVWHRWPCMSPFYSPLQLKCLTQPPPLPPPMFYSCLKETFYVLSTIRAPCSFPCHAAVILSPFSTSLSISCYSEWITVCYHACSTLFCLWLNISSSLPVWQFSWGKIRFIDTIEMNIWT